VVATELAVTSIRAATEANAAENRTRDDNWQFSLTVSSKNILYAHQ